MKKNILYFGLLLAGNIFGAEKKPSDSALRSILREKIEQKERKRKGERPPTVICRNGYRLAEDSAGKEGGTTVTSIRFCNKCYADGVTMGQKKLTRAERLLCNIAGCAFANDVTRGCPEHIREHVEEYHSGAGK